MYGERSPRDSYNPEAPNFSRERGSYQKPPEHPCRPARQTQRAAVPTPAERSSANLSELANGGRTSAAGRTRCWPSPPATARAAESLMALWLSLPSKKAVDLMLGSPCA